MYEGTYGVIAKVEVVHMPSINPWLRLFQESLEYLNFEVQSLQLTYHLRATLAPITTM